MKKILILSLLISSISCAVINTEKDKNKSKTNISETSNYNDLKLAVIEGQRIWKDSKEGQLIEELITKKRDDFAKEIQAIDQKIEKEIADIRAKQRTASQEVLEAKQEILVKLQRSRDNRVQEAEAEFKNFANKLLAGFDKKLRKEAEEARKIYLVQTIPQRISCTWYRILTWLHCIYHIEYKWCSIKK